MVWAKAEVYALITKNKVIVEISELRPPDVLGTISFYSQKEKKHFISYRSNGTQSTSTNISPTSNPCVQRDFQLGKQAYFEVLGEKDARYKGKSWWHSRLQQDRQLTWLRGPSITKSTSSVSHHPLFTARQSSWWLSQAMLSTEICPRYAVSSETLICWAHYLWLCKNNKRLDCLLLREDYSTCLEKNAPFSYYNDAIVHEISKIFLQGN